MPILDLQKRARELGRIRFGDKGDRGQPQKLRHFRFTSNSKSLLDKIAELYGGQVREWQGGTQKFELYSTSDRLPIMVPPQPVTQWHEVWRKAAGCIHRCDGYTNVLLDEPCDPEDPLHQEAIQKPVTRLNVVLRDVEGIGVWRAESKGWNAAREIPDVAQFLAQAGGYVNGWLSLEEREDHGVGDDGEPYNYRYLVPIIEIDVTPAQLMAGGGRVAAPTLEGPVPPRAIGPSDPFVAYHDRVEEAESTDELAAVWHDAVAAHLVGKSAPVTQDALGFTAAFKTRAATIQAGQGGRAAGSGEPAVGGTGEGVADPHATPSPPDTDVVDGELVDEPDADAVWADTFAEAGRHSMTGSQLNADIETFLGGTTSAEASGAELAEYLEDLRKRPIEQAS